ncbi:MAG: ComEC/Rec2 family competence protein [Chloroflexi bacterium]|nr:ComEC/Rec2 family competence protein [Chloroflexota bacterium]
MVVAALALAWLIGTYLALVGEPWVGPGWLPLALGLAALPAAVVAWPARPLRLALLALAGLFLAAARTLSAEAALASDPLDGLQGEVELLGLVASPPERQGERTSLVLDVQARVVEGAWRPQGGRVWLQAYGAPSLTYGDAVLVRGRLAEPRARPGSPMPALLQRQGVRFLVERPRVALVERRQGDPGWAALQQAREAISGALRQQLPEPQASLLAGVLVGTRAQMPPELRQALVASGTSHVVAVSGFNISVVAGLATAALAWAVGRRYALAPALLTLGLYTLLTGPQPSAVRAALMGGAALIATSVGRIADPLTSLLLAGGLMLAVDPFQGLDLGFQLSFLATGGLVLLQPSLARRMAPLPRWLRDPLAVTLAAQIATLPLIVSTFHTLSIVSPLANLLIAPALPPLMALGGLLVVASPVPALAALLAWPNWALLSYVLGVIRLSGDLPGALLSLGALPPLASAGLYALVLLLGLLALPEVRALLGRLPVRVGGGGLRLALLAVPLAALVPLAAVAARPDGRLHASTLDLGSSLAVLVRTPAGRTAVLAGPATPGRLLAVLGQRLRPWETSLGVVVLQSDEEVTRLRPLFARYPAQAIVVPASAEAPPAEAGARVLRVGAGGRVELDREVWLEPLGIAQAGGGPVGWRLVHGEVALTVASGAPAALAGAPVHALLVPAGRPERWQQADTTEAGPRLVVLAELASPSPAEPWPALVLATELHGEVELESDGQQLLVRAQRCAPPLEPPSCALALGSRQ